MIIMADVVFMMKVKDFLMIMSVARSQMMKKLNAIFGRSPKIASIPMYEEMHLNMYSCLCEFQFCLAFAFV